MPPYDTHFLSQAIEISRRGLGQTAPNPSVGALVVCEGDVPVILGRGWTQVGGRPHAEPFALENVQRAGQDVKGTTLYVSLEPCSHHGKTPPCTEAIIQSGIRRVVIGTQDPDPRVSGRGIAQLREAGVSVELAPEDLRKKAEWVLRGHILRMTQNRPFVQLKLAVDKNYKIAPGREGAPVWVTTEEARARGHLLRAQTDAILVGRGTVETDDPTLTCRLPGLFHCSPIRVVLDSTLQISPEANLFKDAPQVPLWIACSEAHHDLEKQKILHQAGAQVLPIPVQNQDPSLSIKNLLTKLSEHGITRLMIEGGPQVARSFWQCGVLDEIVIFQSDRDVGTSGIEALAGVGLRTVLQMPHVILSSERPVGDDMMRVYRVNG